MLRAAASVSLCLLALSHAFAFAADTIPELISTPLITHSSTAALSAKETAVKDETNEKLLQLVQRIRAEEAPRGGPDSEKLKMAGQSGCTWIKTGNTGGDKPTESFQLFMAKMFVKQMCNPVSPLSIKAIPASPHDAFYPSIKDNPDLNAEENKKRFSAKYLLNTVSYNAKDKKSYTTSYKMEENSLENLIPLFSMMYTHAQRETSGNTTNTYRPTYEVDSRSGKNGVLHQWNIGQGFFHAASNTLNFDSTINHPELVRIYSDYATKLNSLINSNQDEATQKQKFDRMCMASSFDKNILDSVGQDEYHNRIKTQKGPGDSSGVDVAWTSLKTYLSPQCVNEAKSFLDKVNRNVSEVVSEHLPQYSKYLDKNPSYKKTYNDLENLRKKLSTLENTIKAKTIDMELSNSKVEAQKKYIDTLKNLWNANQSNFSKINADAKKNGDIFYVRADLKKQYALNLRRIEDLIASKKRQFNQTMGQDLSSTRDELKNLQAQMQYHETQNPKILALTAEETGNPLPFKNIQQQQFEWQKTREDLKKQESNLEAKIKTIIAKGDTQLLDVQTLMKSFDEAAKAQTANNNIISANEAERKQIAESYQQNVREKKSLDKKLTDAHQELTLYEETLEQKTADSENVQRDRDHILQKSINLTETINEARREAASMAFFSLDNTDYSSTKDGVTSSSREVQERTALCFAALQRYCPAFSIDYHSVNARVNNGQFGPISSSPGSFTPSCSNMFQEIYARKDEFCSTDKIAISIPAGSN